MAKKQYFENLLGAMQESILKAHSMIENQHLNVMKRYFDESQKPLTFDIQYPRINPDTGELEYVLVQVPKIALVPMNSLKLKEMKLKFKVKLNPTVRTTCLSPSLTRPTSSIKRAVAPASIVCASQAACSGPPIKDSIGKPPNSSAIFTNAIINYILSVCTLSG